jgi:hypothetical protein
MSITAQGIADGTLTTGNFTIQAQMPMGKTITVSGYIYSTSTLEAINKQVDLMHDVVDRQRLRSEVPELEAKLEQRFVQMGQLRDLMVQLGNKVDSGKKLSSAEKQQYDNIQINIERLNEDIAKGQQALVDARLQLA